jgi:hypothetical protein
MERAVVCLFGKVAGHRITEYERDDDRRELGQYKNYLRHTKDAHILVIIRNYKQKWKNSPNTETRNCYINIKRRSEDALDVGRQDVTNSINVCNGQRARP